MQFNININNLLHPNVYIFLIEAFWSLSYPRNKSQFSRQISSKITKGVETMSFE